jgi:hypothetical protein
MKLLSVFLCQPLFGTSIGKKESNPDATGCTARCGKSIFRDGAMKVPAFEAEKET